MWVIYTFRSGNSTATELPVPPRDNMTTTSETVLIPFVAIPTLPPLEEAVLEKEDEQPWPS